MAGYLVRRLLWALPTLLGITLLTFAAIHAAPGDPIDAMLGFEHEGGLAGGARAERRAALARELGFDRPLAVQYLDFLGPFRLGADGHRWFGGSASTTCRGRGGASFASVGRDPLPTTETYSEVRASP